MKRTLAPWLVSVAAIVLLATPCVRAAGYRMPIGFPGYTNRTEVLTNFPALVVLSNNVGGSGFSYATAVSAGGYDLRFRDAADTTNLNYEIESWNTNGASYVWVQLPTLASDGSTSIWAKWGDGLDAAQQPCTTNGATWSAAFASVYHFADGSGNANDATANRFTATNNAAAFTNAGKAGPAAYINAENASFLRQELTNSVLSASVWYQFGATGGGSWNTIFARNGGSYHHLLINDTSHNIGFWNGNFGDSGLTLVLGTWYHFTVVMAGTSYKLYANGALIYTATAFDNSVSGQRLSRISTHDGTTQAAWGTLDEVRFENVARSTDWIWASYTTVASNASFTSYGFAQQASPGAPMIANVGTANVGATQADLVGNLTTGNTPVTVRCYWGTSDGAAAASAWQKTNSWSAGALGDVTNSIGSGLLSGTRYYFRYYATNGAGEYWAPVSTVFSTLGAPTVDNAGGATGVGQTSTTLNGTLVAGAPSPSVWFYWGTTDGGTNKGAWNQSPLAVGQPALAPFSSALSSLPANQTYYYRSYASNSYGEAWATASSNFTTLQPVLTIGSTNILEGPLGVNTAAVLTVTLSATSAIAVSVNYATTNSTNAVAGTDYTASSGTLTIPPGMAATQLVVTVIGDNLYSPDKTVLMNLTTPTSVILANTQGVVTIQNDDWVFFVRNDGLGSDTNSGASWNKAFATLSKALATCKVVYNPNVWGGPRPYDSTHLKNWVYVQDSTGSQGYAPASFITGYNNAGPWLDVDIQGGWVNVDLSPAQTGVSVVRDSATPATLNGFNFVQGGAAQWRRVTLSHFTISNVVNGVTIDAGTGNSDFSDVMLFVSNTTIRANANGVFLRMSHTYAWNSWGGLCRLNAENVDITGGLTGPGDGISVRGSWLGSSIAASGIDPATGAQRVSVVTSTNGNGLHFSSVSSDGARTILLANLVVYGCSSNGMLLDDGAGNAIQPTLRNCTIADNACDGLYATNGPGSWASVTNSIFANNGGHGLNLGLSGGAASACTEDYNVFFNDDIVTNGTACAFGAHTSTTDPLLFGQRTRPTPWYLIRSALSPAYKRGSDGRNRGAYQNNKIPGATVMIIQ